MISLLISFILLINLLNISFAASNGRIKLHRVLRKCDICDITFKKEIEYEKHINGRKHAESLERYTAPEDLWNEFKVTHWAKDCKPEYVVPLWNNDELTSLGLKMRVNCLHPSPVVGKLSPYQRARLWRYIRDAMGISFYRELGHILSAVDQDESGHLRVKELFENIEAYKVITRFIIGANRTLSNTSTSAPLRNIVELAGGHGLLSVLLAYRFPQMNITCYDLLKRPTFDAFIRAFETYGLKRPNQNKVLPNIHFFEEDLIKSESIIDNTAVVICLHGCGEVNEVSIEIANRKSAAWIVMPCCIKKGQYLHDNCNVLVEDTLRYQILCGALANEYNAQIIEMIDERITNRPIIVAGGVLREEDEEPAFKEDNLRSISRAARTGNLPRLLYH